MSQTVCPGCRGTDGAHEVGCSYQAYVASLEPCPGCGRVDEMDNITGQIMCAACSLDEMSDDDGFWDEDEELRT